jgi:hypothetical protein
MWVELPSRPAFRGEKENQVFPHATVIRRKIAA